jgi:hypothetical protein
MVEGIDLKEEYRKLPPGKKARILKRYMGQFKRSQRTFYDRLNQTFTSGNQAAIGTEIDFLKTQLI